MAAITGDAELDRKLRELTEKSADKALEAGVRASLTPLTRALRAAVNASSASPALKRAARQAIGRRAGKKKRGAGKGQFEAKGGFAVGKKKKATAERPAKKRGKGISTNNIHWPVLGTKKRQTKAGKNTGEMPQLLGEVTDQAYAQSKEAMLEAAKKKIGTVIAREAAKRTGG